MKVIGKYLILLLVAILVLVDVEKTEEILKTLLHLKLKHLIIRVEY